MLTRYRGVDPGSCFNAGAHRLVMQGMAAIVCAILLAAGTGAQSPAADPWPALVARARDVVGRLVSGDVDPLPADFTDQMKAAASPATLRTLVPGLVVQMGRFQSIDSTQTSERDGVRAVSVRTTFERGLADIVIAFNAEGKTAGISVRPVSTAPYVAAPYTDPAAFRDREVTVDAGGWPLPATLSLPVGDGPFPAVVLVHGSGPQDRDSSFGPNRIFRDLAEGLASRGLAVLRYEKRTRVHAARANRLQLTVQEEVIDDAVAAVELLRTTAGIRSDCIFVLGHSLGGMLAPRIAAAADNHVAGLIVLAGAVRSLQQSIVDQSRYLAELDGRITPDEQAQLDAYVEFAAAVATLQPSSPPVTAPGLSAPASYLIDLRDYSPIEAARALRLPMLFLQGERDYQVTMADFARWKEALGDRADVQFESYRALNHLFLAGSGPSAPAEYGVAGHIDGDVVRDVAAWVRARSAPVR